MSQKEVYADENENGEKAFFAVLDVADGRRYKVFVRPDSIPKLKLGKIRKTLSSTAGKPPFSFELWLGDESLECMEDENCFTLGITPQTVLHMRPSRAGATAAMMLGSNGESITAEASASGNVGNSCKDKLYGASYVEESVLSLDGVMKQMVSETSDASPVVELNERQRALQAQLYEEAKRCQVFSPTFLPSGGNSGEAGGGASLSSLHAPYDTYQLPSMLVGNLRGEHSNETDGSLTEIIEGIVGIKGSGPMPPSSGMVMDGVQYYNMYSAEEDEGKVEEGKENVVRSENKYKHVQWGSLHSVASNNAIPNDKVSNVLCGTPNLTAVAATSTEMCTETREMFLADLVEKLRDDVAELTALQVRSEGIKQALQQELAASQRRESNLQKKEQQTRQQLDAVLSHLQSQQDEEGRPVFSADAIRDAVCNMVAEHRNELLQREKIALERRLMQEIQRSSEMALVIEEMKGNIRVLVRVRPQLRFLREQEDMMEQEDVKTEAGSAADSARMLVDGERITIADPHGAVREFDFYHVFSESSTQADVFSEVAPLVQLACNGINVSVLAYGQTGSGKTHTIFGSGPQECITVEDNKDSGGKNTKYEKDGEEDDSEEVEQQEHNEIDDGIVPRAIRLLFHLLRREAQQERIIMPCGNDRDENGSKMPYSSSSSTFEVSCSLLELYNDKIHDLLAPPQVVVPNFRVGGHNNSTEQKHARTLNAPQRTVKIGQDGLMYVVGLTQHVVRNARDALRVFREGASRRQVHATQKNSSSSRSHLIFTLHLAQRRRVCVQRGEKNQTSIAYKRLESKMVFVDLAGSERIAKSQNVGDRITEARYINKSLSALGDVLATLSNASASASGAAHVPYRNSVLTALLQDVIGSRSKTVLVACVGPSDPSYEKQTAETVTTLQFASRVRCVRNFATGFPSTPSLSSSLTRSVNVYSSDADPCSSRFKRHSLPLTTFDSAESLSARKSGAKLWMRPTESSKKRVGAAPRTPNAVPPTVKETDRVDESRPALSPLPPRMRF